MNNDRVPPEEIAARLGVTTDAVFAAATTALVTMHGGGGRSTGFNDADVAKIARVVTSNASTRPPTAKQQIIAQGKAITAANRRPPDMGKAGDPLPMPASAGGGRIDGGKITHPNADAFANLASQEWESNVCGVRETFIDKPTYTRFRVRQLVTGHPVERTK